VHSSVSVLGELITQEKGARIFGMQKEFISTTSGGKEEKESGRKSSSFGIKRRKWVEIGAVGSPLSKQDRFVPRLLELGGAQAPVCIAISSQDLIVPEVEGSLHVLDAPLGGVIAIAGAARSAATHEVRDEWGHPNVCSGRAVRGGRSIIIIIIITIIIIGGGRGEEVQQIKPMAMEMV
jgi:hypothetical protein